MPTGRTVQGPDADRKQSREKLPPGLKRVMLLSFLHFLAALPLPVVQYALGRGGPGGRPGNV